MKLKPRSDRKRLFQVICNRYQRNQPIALTSNNAFADWGQVFADDPDMASAALDRLFHRSTVINIRGVSNRRMFADMAERDHRPNAQQR